MFLPRRSLLGGGALFGLAATLSRAAAAPSARLSLNENPYGPAPSVRAVLENQLGDLSRYGDSSAADALVAEISRLESVPTDQIVLGEILTVLGLFLAAQAPAGGRFVYSVPGYTALVDAARPLGGEVIGVPLDPRSLGNDLPALERAAAGAKVLYLINPHNPTGTVSDPAAFEAFLRRVSRRTLVVVDEAYLEYATGAATVAPLVAEGLNVAVFRTLDKIYGLAALPVGYLLAPKQLATSLRAAGFGDAHELGRLEIAAARAALADQGRVAEIRRRIAAGRATLTTALDRLRLEHTRSQADFIFFRSPLPADAAREALARHGIIVARAFPPLDPWIRISVGTEDEVRNTVAALEAVFGSGR